MAKSVFMVLLCAGPLSADSDSITPKIVQLPYVQDFAWDATRSRLFASAGSSIIMIDPETAQVEDTIATGVSAGRIAVSDDGQYLYAAVGSRGIVQRYRLQTHAVELEIPLGTDRQGHNLCAAAMVALPGQPQSILIARGSWLGDNYLFSIASQDVAVYNDAVPRKGTLSLDVRSFYIQGGRGATLSRRISLDGLRAPRPIRRSVDPVFGWVPGHAYQFTVSADGVALGRSFLVPVSFSKDSLPTWNGSLLSDRAGTVVDVGTGVPLGRAAMGASGCALAPDWTGDTVLAAQADASRFNPPAHLVQYSLDSFRASGTVSVAPTQDFLGACDFASM